MQVLIFSKEKFCRILDHLLGEILLPGLLRIINLLKDIHHDDLLTFIYIRLIILYLILPI